LTAVAAVYWFIISTAGLVIAQSRAEEWQNVAVYSMISTDEGAPLIKQALTAAGHPGLLDDFESAQREAFVTMDLSKPKGLVWQTNGRSFRFLAFAAMKDVTELPYGIGDMVAAAEVNNDGWYKIPLPNAAQMSIMYQNVFVKQQGDWAYVCYGVASAPKELPLDPTVLLEGLPQEYPVALRFNFAALPRGIVNGWGALGKMSLSMMKTFMPMFQQQIGPEREFETQLALATFDFVTVVGKETIDQIVKFVNETESLTIGLSGNADSDVIVTCKLVAKPGTDTAKGIERIGTGTTDLIGFYRPDEAIYTEIYTYPIEEYEKPFFKNILVAADKWLDIVDVAGHKELVRNQDRTDVVELFDKGMAFAKRISGVLRQTIDTGKIDCADFVTTDMSYIAAVKIAGGKALVEPINDLCDSVMLRLAEMMVDFGLDSDQVLERETYQDFQLWKVTIPIARLGHELPNLGPLVYVIGLSDDMLVFAYGLSPTAADTLKKAMDESGKPVPAPREIAVFTPEKIGRYIKTYGFDLMYTDDVLEAYGNKEGKAAMDIIFNIPENAKIVVTQDVEAHVLTWTWVFDGRLWPTVGAIVDKFIEQSDGMLPF